MTRLLQIQDARTSKRERPYFVWKRHRRANATSWKRWDPPWDSYEEASEAAYRMAGGGRSSIDPYFDEKYAELYVGQTSPVDRWGRYKTRALADRYSVPGQIDHTWIPGRDSPSPRRSRDADYRGVKSTVDWSKLVHMTQMRKEGALEVLQDAIETWFPKQFKRAQTNALARLKYVRAKGAVIYVVFNGRTARRRFELPRKRTKAQRLLDQRYGKSTQSPQAKPFSFLSNDDLRWIRKRGFPTNSVIVHSTRSGKDVAEAVTTFTQKRAKQT